MSDYLRPIVNDFDPAEYSNPTDEELEAILPEEPSGDEVLDAIQSLRSQKQVGGAILTGKILWELFDLSKRVRDDITIIRESPAREWSRDQKDSVHLFFAFVGQVQDHLLRQAVVRHVIDDEATTEQMKEKIVSDDTGRGMPARECLNYLDAGGLIDSGLKGEIGQVRNERNEAVHDITRWFFAEFDLQTLEAQVARGERSVVRLLELVYGFELE